MRILRGKLGAYIGESLTSGWMFHKGGLESMVWGSLRDLLHVRLNRSLGTSGTMADGLHGVRMSLEQVVE